MPSGVSEPPHEQPPLPSIASRVSLTGTEIVSLAHCSLLPEVPIENDGLTVKTAAPSKTRTVSGHEPVLSTCLSELDSAFQAGVKLDLSDRMSQAADAAGLPDPSLLSSSPAPAGNAQTQVVACSQVAQNSASKPAFQVRHMSATRVPFSPRFVPRDAASTAGDSQQNRDERSELGQRFPRPLWADREDVIAYLHKIKTWARCCSQCPTLLAPTEDRCLYCNFITEPLNPDMYFWWQERTGLQAMRVVLQKYGAALIEGPSWGRPEVGSSRP